MHTARVAAAAALFLLSPVLSAAPPEPLPDAARAQHVRELRFGMFVCWSLSTFSGYEWTRGIHDPGFFRATGCDTDQWCQAAKAAGMNYILFLTKHHDGFCLWDTQTTDFKVTRAPLGIDVLAKLRESCNRSGIKLALYFSEGDWTWIKGDMPSNGPVAPGSPQWRNPKWRQGVNAALKKAQLKELCTNYGPIEFFWMDHAQGEGGLGHPETVEWVHRFQPDCFVGFNHGPPAGRLCIRERGRPGPIGASGVRRHNAAGEKSYANYLVAEFTYPILPAHRGGAQWFYSLPEHDQLCLPAEKVYRDYLGAVKYGNIFSLDVGPDYAGRLRQVDVQTLRAIGRYVRGEDHVPEPIPVARASASGEWSEEYAADKAADGDLSTRWGGTPESRSGWLELEFAAPATIGRAVLREYAKRVQRFSLKAQVDGRWQQLAAGTELGPRRELRFAPVRTPRVRLQIEQANEVPSIYEFELYGAD